MPPTIEIDIKEIVNQINQKLDTLTKEVFELKTEVKVGQAEVKAELTRLNDKISGIEKRMDFQEFLSKGLLITLIGAVFGILAKLFGFIGNP